MLLAKKSIKAAQGQLPSLKPVDKTLVYFMVWGEIEGGSKNLGNTHVPDRDYFDCVGGSWQRSDYS